MAFLGALFAEFSGHRSPTVPCAATERWILRIRTLASLSPRIQMDESSRIQIFGSLGGTLAYREMNLSGFIVQFGYSILGCVMPKSIAAN